LLVRLVLLPLKALVFALISAIQLTLELLQLLTVLLGLLSASLVVPRSGLHERDVERVNPKDAANVGHMPITERLGGLVDNLVTDLTPIDCGDALLNHLGGDDEVVRDAVPIPAAGLPLNGPGQCLPLGDGEDRLVLHLVAVLIAARWAFLQASGAGQVVHLIDDLRPTDEPRPLGAHNRFAAGEHVRRDAVNVPTRRVARQDATLSVPPVCLPEAASVTRIAVAVLNVPRTSVGLAGWVWAAVWEVLLLRTGRRIGLEQAVGPGLRVNRRGVPAGFLADNPRRILPLLSSPPVAGEHLPHNILGRAGNAGHVNTSRGTGHSVHSVGLSLQRLFDSRTHLVTNRGRHKVNVPRIVAPRFENVLQLLLAGGHCPGDEGRNGDEGASAAGAVRTALKHPATKSHGGRRIHRPVNVVRVVTGPGIETEAASAVSDDLAILDLAGESRAVD